MSNESTSRTLVITLLVTIVCSVLVSFSVVYLRPRQELNKEADRKRNILMAIGIKASADEVDEKFKVITPFVVDIVTGEQSEIITPENYDTSRLEKDAANIIVLNKNNDIAGIKKILRYQMIYLVKAESVVQNIILPVYGKGLWSTMYGFLALESDAQTIKGLTFYEHGETPGLGGEVDNPKWKALWPGKKISDDLENVRIEIIKGHAETSDDDAQYKVDGISGATLTSRGVGNLVRFWAGKDGYGKYLTSLIQGQKSKGGTR